MTTFSNRLFHLKNPVKHSTGKGRSGGSGSGGSGLAGVTFAVAVGNYSAGIIVPTI